MKILSGTSNLKLSKNIAKNLKLKLINTNIRRFADGEIYIEINEKEHSVDSIENRMLLFPAQTRHKLIYHTDVHKRYVINFNFIGDKNYGSN